MIVDSMVLNFAFFHEDFLTFHKSTRSENQTQACQTPTGAWLMGYVRFITTVWLQSVFSFSGEEPT